MIIRVRRSLATTLRELILSSLAAEVAWPRGTRQDSSFVPSRHSADSGGESAHGRI